ncbi:unnamed protein product [Protopolystoma xenopodis]|uniref:Uncharacterized protein n=1 Tax=Protopolystoma xenopodis TaxID=117903 RepID=A0A3S4ZQZ5_9PLAT|nr:unnamed protein product [Protopolystoma xenopodis]
MYTVRQAATHPPPCYKDRDFRSFDIIVFDPLTPTKESYLATTSGENLNKMGAMISCLLAENGYLIFVLQHPKSYTQEEQDKRISTLMSKITNTNKKPEHYATIDIPTGLFNERRVQIIIFIGRPNADGGEKLSQAFHDMHKIDALSDLESRCLIKEALRNIVGTIN